MPTISIESQIKILLPNITLGCLEATVKVHSSTDKQKEWMHQALEKIKEGLTPEKIRQTNTVKATKEAYKTLGKDPNRYRPAAEALLRRVANGKDLYQISNVVDILNYISIKTGFSICGYDLDLIDGDISLGIAKAGEPYEGIGRGTLNIESLPVFRDKQGAFGTPTSDSIRTKISDNTQNLLYIFMNFSGDTQLKHAIDETVDLLKEYAMASCVKTYYI